MIKHRVAIGLPLIALAAAAVCWPGTPGAVLFVLLCGTFFSLASWEFFRMAAALDLPGCPRLAIVAGLALIAGSTVIYRLGPASDRLLLAWDVLVLTVFLGAVLFVVLRTPPSKTGIHVFVASVTGFVYVSWCLSFIPKVYFNSGIGASGRYLTFFLVFVAKAGDMGAFTIGTLTAKRPGGNHKLIPMLSPKKSWEGLAGGIIGSLTAAGLLAYVWQDHLLVFGEPVLGPVGAVFFGLFLPIAGLGGDLAESYLKRASGFKDSGHIPGLGGALDIVDSLIPAAPVFYAYLHIAATIVEA